MAILNVRLLGGFEARAEHGPPIPLQTKKTRALLAYLSMRPGQSHARESLATMLWEDSPCSKARGSLRQSASLLRRSLAVSGCYGLDGDSDSLRLDPEGLEVDAVTLERLYDAGTPETLECAAALYRGDFLEGLNLREGSFEEWASGERARLRELGIGLFTRLLDHYVETGALEKGIRTAIRLLTLDPLQEPVHRTLMRLYRFQDRMGAALRQYEACRDTLESELGVAPDAQTEALYRQIVGQVRPRGEHAPPSAPEPSSRVGLSGGNGGGAIRETLGEGAYADAWASSIAVLPFNAIGDDPDSRYLGDGISEDVITALARFREIGVIARNSSFVYRGGETPVVEIGKALDVRYVLDGSVRHSGDETRIAAQLVDARTGRHVWAQHYDCHREELFAAQDDVTRRIVATLVGRIGGDRCALAMRKAPEALAAYECWLRGMGCLRQTRKRVALAEARRHFEMSLEIDPNYARGHAGLALTQFDEWACYAWTPLNWLDPSGLDHALRAVELDESDHHVRCILGVMYLFRREFDLARGHLDRALALNPNDANTLAHLALCLPLLGEAEEGVAAGEAALRLDPYYPDWYAASLGLAYFVARRYDESVATTEVVPEAFCDTQGYIAAARALSGRDEKGTRRHVDAMVERYEFKKAADPAWPYTGPLDWLVSMSPYRRHEDADHFADGLRKAGIH